MFIGTQSDGRVHAFQSSGRASAGRYLFRTVIFYSFRIIKRINEISGLYYKEHEKRVKRKMIKIANLPRSTEVPVATLSTEMALVRYELKVGLFCELRRDIVSAIKAYESAYTTLNDIIKSGLSAHIEPRIDYIPYSARWYEAVSLSDALSMKMSKILLLQNAGVDALCQLLRHVAHWELVPSFIFNIFCSVPYPNVLTSGIRHLVHPGGGGSFEYWAWVSKLY